MEDSVYRTPLTTEYTTRGCNVKIDAATCSERVTITVNNIKTGNGSSYTHILLPGNIDGYSDKDMRKIQDELNKLLDEYGESEWNEIHFTNQILS